MKTHAAILTLLLAGSAAAQDAASLESTIAKASNATLGKARYAIERTVVLDSLAVVQGRGTERTVFAGDGKTSLFVSRDAAEWRAKNLGAWAGSGVTARIELRDAGCHGTGKLVSDDSWKWQDKAPLGPPAIDLWGPGTVLENIDVYDWPGVAIRTGRGGENRSGGLLSTDREVGRLLHVSVSRCFAGPVVGPEADGVIHDLDVGMVRDWGLKLEASATNVDQLHLWGVGGEPTAEDPDRGAGLIDGKRDGSTGGNHYGAVQVDGCAIGVVSYVPSDWSKVICQKCERTSFDVHRRCDVTQLVIQDMADWYGRDGHERIGLRLRPTSAWCVVCGAITATNAPGRDNADAIAALIDGHNQTVTLVVYAPWAKTPVVIGRDSAPSGCTLNLALAGETRVVIERLGTRNTIRVRSKDGWDAVDGEEKFQAGNTFEVF